MLLVYQLRNGHFHPCSLTFFSQISKYLFMAHPVQFFQKLSQLLLGKSSFCESHQCFQREIADHAEKRNPPAGLPG